MHGRIRDLLPEFAPLRTSRVRQVRPIPARFLLSARPGKAWSWCQSFLSGARTDWQRDRRRLAFLKDRSEAALRRPPRSRTVRMFPWNEIHLDNGGAKSLPQSCIPLRLPNGRQALALCRTRPRVPRAPGQQEARVQWDALTGHTRDPWQRRAAYHRNHPHESKRRSRRQRSAEKFSAPIRWRWLFRRRGRDFQDTRGKWFLSAPWNRP